MKSLELKRAREASSAIEEATLSKDHGTTPKKVMIIRHGEKLGDPKDDKDAGPNLSARGAARAAALPGLFLPAAMSRECALEHQSHAGLTATYMPGKVPKAAARFPAPDFLFATAHSPESKRPRQTITPLAAALGLPINHDYGEKKKDIDALAALLRTSHYVGKTILICWHHGAIPDLATALGATGATPWAATVFDRIWVIDYDTAPAIRQFGQELLFGDEINVPALPW